MTIDKVLVSAPSTTEKLAKAKDRKARLDPVVSYLQQGIAAVKTLVTIRAMGDSGLRIVQHLAASYGEVEAELALAERDIAHLEQVLAAEELVIQRQTISSSKGGRRVPRK